MSLPITSRFAGPCLLLLLPCLGLVSSIATQTPPNIVFLLVDDLGYMDVGAFNPATFYDTPHIDALATSGMRFTHAYAAAQVCSPTRGSILTGRYPSRFQVTDFIQPGGQNQPERWNRNTRLLPAPYQDQLPLAEVTLAELLKAEGYATFFAGKWHLGGAGHLPTDQGFDHNLGGLDRGGPYGGNNYFSPYGNPYLPDGPDGEHLPARLARETVRFIEAHRNQPFLAYLSFYSVHVPLMARTDLQEKYEARRQRLGLQPEWGTEHLRKVRLVQEHAVYAGMVEAMDEAVGTVLEALHRLGLADNTIVVFTSDNGGLSTSEGHPTSNLPLRGGKGWIYEGGIRVPTIVRWPGLTPAGTTNATIASSVDWVPTLLAASGIRPPEGLEIDGTSLLPALQGERMSREPVFWHYPHYGNQGGFPSGAVREGPWKLIENYEDGSLQLYHLEDDPEERHDLAARFPARATALQTQLASWRVAVHARMPALNPAFRRSQPEGR